MSEGKLLPKGDCFLTEEKGDQAYTQIISSVREVTKQTGKRSIDLTYFIYELCGPASWILNEELIKAAKSGVKIRILVDAYTHGKEEWAGISESFRQKGIELKYFNMASDWNPQRNNRTHIKIILFNGESYVTGGRNIADDYFNFREGMGWIDNDVYVKGPSAKQAQIDFNSLWNSRLSQFPSKDLDPQPGINFLKECATKDLKEKAKLRQLLATVWQKPVPAKTFQCIGRFISDSPQFIDVLSNSPTEGDNYNNSYMTAERLYLKRTTTEVMKALGSAKKEILAENWSYTPQADIRNILIEKRDAGVNIKIFTNLDAEDVSSTDIITRRRAKSDSKGTMIVMPIHSSSLVPDRNLMSPLKLSPSYHTKTFVVDNHRTIISSWNMDARSYHTNLESGWVSDNCPELAKAMKQHSAQVIKPPNSNSPRHVLTEPSLSSELYAWLIHELL